MRKQNDSSNLRQISSNEKMMKMELLSHILTDELIHFNRSKKKKKKYP
jgi:hypothetical protein